MPSGQLAWVREEGRKECVAMVCLKGGKAVERKSCMPAPLIAQDLVVLLHCLLHGEAASLPLVFRSVKAT